jgi:putative membrane protein
MISAYLPSCLAAQRQHQLQQGETMKLVADFLVGLIAVLHVWILVLEMFLWTKPFGLKTFGQSREAAEASKVLAANQGLYNGFLAAGLAWGLISGDGAVKLFFVACVLVAGIYGGLTAKRSILYVQALPALLALIALLASR